MKGRGVQGQAAEGQNGQGHGGQGHGGQGRTFRFLRKKQESAGNAYSIRGRKAVCRKLPDVTVLLHCPRGTGAQVCGRITGGV
jgi:hypothetical protein